MEAGAAGFGVGISTLLTTGGGGAGFLVVGLDFNRFSSFIPFLKILKVFMELTLLFRP